MTTKLQHPLPLDGQLCFALYGTSMAMSRVYKPMLDRLGLTYPQYLVLHTLWEVEGRTIGEIAERLSLEPSTITPLVKRLARSGLVERGRDPNDERHVRVGLTERGRALRANSVCLAEEVLARTGLSVAQMALLTEQVRAVRRALAGVEDNAA